MCVFVGKQLQLYECKVNIFRVSIFRPSLIIPQDSSLTNLAPDSYQKIRIVAIFQRSASPLPARTLAITPQSVKLSPAAALSNKAANDSSVFTKMEKAPIKAFSWLKCLKCESNCMHFQLGEGPNSCLSVIVKSSQTFEALVPTLGSSTCRLPRRL